MLWACGCDRPRAGQIRQREHALCDVLTLKFNLVCAEPKIVVHQAGFIARQHRWERSARPCLLHFVRGPSHATLPVTLAQLQLREALLIPVVRFRVGTCLACATAS